MKIILGTGNADKLKEIVELCNLPIKFRLASDFTQEQPEETGATLLENALQKANYYHELTGMPTLSDDTGLFVEALGGRPGIHSARYAGENATYKTNRRKLQVELNGIENPIHAYFSTIVAYVTTLGKWTFEGRCDGIITIQEQGENGFGYDSMFIPNGFSKTFAEMTKEEKNRISHRSKAFEKFKSAFLNGAFN